MVDRFYARTLPSNFIVYDDTVDSADEYINMRDEQVLRLNHNMLLARSVRRPILHQKVNIGTGSGTSPGSSHAYVTQFPAASYYQESFFNGTVRISPHVKEVLCKIRAKRIDTTGMSAATNDTSDLVVYPQFTRLHQKRGPSFHVSMTITSTSLATYSVTVPLPVTTPSTVSDGPNLYSFQLMTDGLVFGSFSSGPNASDYKRNGAITGAGNKYIDTAVALDSTDEEKLIFFDNTDIGPRLITKVEQIGASTYRAWTDLSWNIIPNPNSDTMRIAYMQQLILDTISLYELEFTDFKNTSGLA